MQNRSGAGHQAIKKTTLRKSVAPAVAAQAKTDSVPNFPIDTFYPAIILTADGVFHDDEVDPKSAGHEWKGLFKANGSYYITSTKLKIRRATDAIVDEGSQKTGWSVTPSVKDSALLLIADLNYLLPSATVTQINLTKQQLLPGETETFIFNNVKYKLFATGSKIHEDGDTTAYQVSNYKLLLQANINGKTITQLITAVKGFDDAMTHFLFAGDIDGDGKPDFIIDTSPHYNEMAPTLYLSKPAQPGQLLKIMGMHATVGC